MSKIIRSLKWRGPHNAPLHQKTSLLIKGLVTSDKKITFSSVRLAELKALQIQEPDRIRGMTWLKGRDDKMMARFWWMKPARHRSLKGWFGKEREKCGKKQSAGSVVKKTGRDLRLGQNIRGKRMNGMSIFATHKPLQAWDYNSYIAHCLNLRIPSKCNHATQRD